MYFSNILGQEIPLKIIQNAVKAEKYAHAYLFVGPEGVGKKSTAFAFARLLNCKHRVAIDNKGEKHASGADLALQDINTYDACGECISCKKIEKQIHPDVSFIYPEKKDIRINQMRTLKYQAQFKPMEGSCKVYIIDKARMMNKESANSVLKLLEEPPDRVLIILIAQNKYGILPTIISRCQVIKFNLLSDNLIVRSLREKYKIEEEKALFFSQLSNGSIGKAFSLSQGKTEESKKKADFLIAKIIQGDFISLFSESEKLSFSKDREELEKILSIMMAAYKQKMYKNPNGKYQSILEIILQTKENIKRNINVGIALDEMFLSINRIIEDKEIARII
ncbi:DNA polymerase III subunit delta' [bacterium]|nr:DNA polymerase III subunit delta' [bacterium]